MLVSAGKGGIGKIDLVHTIAVRKQTCHLVLTASLRSGIIEL